MLSANNVSLSFSDKQLFKDVNLKFTHGNSGKSTFLRVLSGEIEANKGDVSLTPGERIAVLKQDHFQYDDKTVMDTVIMGH